MEKGIINLFTNVDDTDLIDVFRPGAPVGAKAKSISALQLATYIAYVTGSVTIDITDHSLDLVAGNNTLTHSLGTENIVAIAVLKDGTKLDIIEFDVIDADNINIPSAVGIAGVTVKILYKIW